MRKRIEELDYLKCLFIILMIIFHLVYIGDKYPYLKSIVYTFHMSGFLAISGYLLNTNKQMSDFLRALVWIFIPYAIMEASYVIMASVLPIREHINELTASVVINKIFVSPIGPYWYLHTLILCSIIGYLANRFKLLNKITRFIVLGILFFVFSHYLGLLSFKNALYFMAGMLIKQSGVAFVSVFQPSKLSIIPLLILCCFPENLDRGTLGGIAITYFTISFLLSVYPYIPSKIKSIGSFIGRNTLILLLFSPIFTFLSKQLVPLFSFEPYGILFTCVAVTFTLLGCFTIAWLMDKLHATRFFLGKDHALN